MLFKRDERKLCNLLYLRSLSVIVILLVFTLVPSISNPQTPSNSPVDTTKFYKNTNAMVDSTIYEFNNRLSKIENYLLSPLCDNLLHPRNVMGIASFIIIGVTLIIFAVNAFITVQSWLFFKDLRSEYHKDIEDFRYNERMSSKALKDMKDEADRLRHDEKCMTEELKTFSEEVKNIAESVKQEIKVMSKKHNDTMNQSINSVIEKFSEIFSDRVTLKRFEVIRSKAFFFLGDEREKIRSLQYIGFLGGSEDVEFLDKVAADSQQNAEVRLVAQKAKTMIEQRKPTSSKKEEKL